MKCLDNLVINDYIDNALNETEMLSVKNHLLHCNKCNSVFQKFNQSSILIKSISFPIVEVSDNFVSNILEKIEKIEHPTFDELSAYHDNDLSMENSVIIRNHLEDCYPCEQTFNSINFESDVLTNLDSYEPSDSFFDSLMAKLDKIEDHISKEDLSAYIDQEFNHIDKVKLENHLENCAECKAEIEGLNKLKKITTSLREPVLPINFSEKVILRIDKNESKILHLSNFVKRALPRISVAVAIFGALLLPMSRGTQNVIQTADLSISENVIITEHSEDYIFGTQTTTVDSIDVLSESKRDNSLEIQDIGL